MASVWSDFDEDGHDTGSGVRQRRHLRCVYRRAPRNPASAYQSTTVSVTQVLSTVTMTTTKFGLISTKTATNPAATCALISASFIAARQSTRR